METDKLILRIIWTWKGSRRAKNLLNKVIVLALLKMKTYYKAIFIKTMWYWHEDRQRCQWDRREGP